MSDHGRLTDAELACLKNLAASMTRLRVEGAALVEKAAEEIDRLRQDVRIAAEVERQLRLRLKALIGK